MERWDDLCARRAIANPIVAAEPVELNCCNLCYEYHDGRAQQRDEHLATRPANADARRRHRRHASVSRPRSPVSQHHSKVTWRPCTSHGSVPAVPGSLVGLRPRPLSDEAMFEIRSREPWHRPPPRRRCGPSANQGRHMTCGRSLCSESLHGPLRPEAGAFIYPRGSMHASRTNI